MYKSTFRFVFGSNLELSFRTQLYLSFALHFPFISMMKSRCTEM